MNQKFGMMDVGNFTPKKELLNWIEEYLKLKVQKIEDLGQGSVFCQILDACFPGQVPLNRVNWKPTSEYQYILNFKILTNAMNKLKVIKIVDVPKLVNCRIQDNLELCQWLKRFFDLNKPGDYQSYDAIKRRNYQVTPFDIQDPKEQIFSEDFKKGNVKQVTSFTESKKNMNLEGESKNQNLLFQECREILLNSNNLNYQEQVQQLRRKFDIPISVQQSEQKPKKQVLQEKIDNCQENSMQCEQNEQSAQSGNFYDKENMNTANFGQLLNQQQQKSNAKQCIYFSNSKVQQQEQNNSQQIQQQ